MKREHCENLRPGQFIVVTECLDEEEKSEFGYFFRAHRRDLVDGIPLMVLAYSDPFVAVTGPGRIFAVDRRRYAFARVTKQYASAFVNAIGAVDPHTGECSRPRRGLPRMQRKRKLKPDASRCIRCGRKLRERFQAKPKPFWVMYCPDCGWTGEPQFAEE